MVSQELLVGLTLLAALAYLVRRSWIAWRGRSCGGCGSACTTTPPRQAAQALIPSEQITLRVRTRR